jgi:chemotaxis protein CheC
MNSIEQSFSKLVDLSSKRAGAAFAGMLEMPVSVQLSLAELVVPQGGTGFLDPATRWGKAIHIHFYDEILGDALFLLPAGSETSLVAAIFAQNPELKGGQDAADNIFLELGNVVLNACVGSIANHLIRRVKYQMPQLIESAQVNSMLKPSSEQRSKLLRMMSTLAVGEINVRANIVIIIRTHTDVIGRLIK